MIKTNYKEQAITLIALVITIIILLILAGVTISTALGQNGLFQRAKTVGEEYKKAEEKEQLALDDISNEIDKVSADKAGTNLEIPKNKNWNKEIVSAIADGEGGVIPLPKDFYYAGGSISTGIVISDKENDDLNNSKKGNQFVWVPCSETQYNNAKNDVMDNSWSCNNEYKDNGNSTGKQTKGGTGDGKAWRDNYTLDDKTELDKSYIGDNILPVENWIANNQITIGTESIRKYGGFYIARYEAGIPENATGIYTNTSGTYTIEGRGNQSETSKIKKLKPVSKKDMQTWNCITQPNAKLISEKMYEGKESVGSYLVDSQAWNIICNKFQEIIGDGTEEGNIGKGIKNSSEIGNYYDNKQTDYTKINGLWALHKRIPADIEPAKEYKLGSIQSIEATKGEGEYRIELATGSSETFKTYNIYDMAGNMWEWTTGHNVIEKEDSTKQMFVVPRGGSFVFEGPSFPVVQANGHDDETKCNAQVGFRVVLYVK